MSRKRFITLLVAAVVAISAAMYLSTQRNPRRDSHGTALLPALANELNSVTVLSVRKGSATPTVTVHRHGGQWTVAERADYPADVSKLRKLLLALSDAKIVEEKTSNPANFPIIGVEDPSQPGGTGAEITIVARDGKHSVFVGKPAGEGNFVRRGGENTSYIAEPAISFEAEPRFWIAPRLFNIPVTTLQSVEIKPATGPAYGVHRVTAKDVPAAPGTGGHGTPAGNPAPVVDKFALDGIPAGRKAADPASLMPSPTTYSDLDADDVAPAGTVDFSKATVATVTLADGNVITITGVVSGDKHWIQLKASKDSALTEKSAGRAFEISNYRYDAIFRPLEQLLVPKPPPPAAAGSKPGAKASKKPVPAPAS